MLKKWQHVQRRYAQYHQYAKDRYQDFRIYNLASYALNRITPRRGYQLKQNIAYGQAARQQLDLYKSDDPHAKKPLLLFVHGGAWSTGDKSTYRFLGHAFASQGFDVAIINYHLAPQHIFPTSVDDLVLALNFLHAAQNRLGVSTNHVLLMGHSAGAFNAMSALYTAQRYHIK